MWNLLIETRAISNKRNNRRPTLVPAILFYFWHKSIEKKSIVERNQQQPPQENQRNPRGNQEIMPILGPTFHVTTKLLQVILRPLTHQIESTLVLTNVIIICDKSPHSKEEKEENDSHQNYKI